MKNITPVSRETKTSYVEHVRSGCVTRSLAEEKRLGLFKTTFKTILLTIDLG